MQKYQRCLAIIPRLRVPKSGGVEAELERLREEAEEYPLRNSQLAAVRYYLRDMISDCCERWNRDWMKGISNYKTLLDQIEQWRVKSQESVSLVTFNYDTLLEDALCDVGLLIRSIDDYISAHRHYRVFKLHGSVNWARIVGVPINPYVSSDPTVSADTGLQLTTDELIEKVSELKTSEKYCYIPAQLTAIHERNVVFPAIAIPVEKKDVFECPWAHLNVLQENLGNVRKLLVIGWRAREEHFLFMLREGLRSPLHVMVVDAKKSEADKVKSNLERAIGPADGNLRRYTSFEYGLTQFVVARSVDSFLAM